MYVSEDVCFCFIPSDDDLVPYDMSFDKKMSKVKAPKYIRDCMEGGGVTVFCLLVFFCSSCITVLDFSVIYMSYHLFLFMDYKVVPDCSQTLALYVCVHVHVCVCVCVCEGGVYRCISV